MGNNNVQVCLDLDINACHKAMSRDCFSVAVGTSA